MTGTMKEWYHNLGTLKQDELHHLETRNNILGVLHREFVDDMEIFDRKNIQELFEMKCYSLKTKDLDKHYHRMRQRYYVLNGYNDPSLKNTFVSSLPQELQPKIHKILAVTQKDIRTMSLGQIHQVTLEALEKIYSFHHQFSEVIEQNSKFTHACRKPYLEIKCKDKSFVNEETIFALQDSSSDEKSFSKSKDDRYLPVYSFKEIGSSLHTPRLPCVEVHVLATKFSCPKKVIAYMDNRAHITMMNPSILPAESWVTHVAYIVATYGKFLKTNLMTKEKIGIKFFLDCIVRTRVIGSNLSNKYIVVGLDVYSAASKLQILPIRIKFKREFKPYFGILKLYSLSKIPASYEEIKSNLLKLYADIHEKFLHLKPLWKNKYFFVQLPFKLNEDVNATKATHPGISPSDYTLVREERNQLLKFPSKTNEIDESSIPNAKEKTPPWGTNQTEVVKALKKIAQTSSALKINGNGKRILQTDASDHYWRAVLVEELEGKIYYCGMPVANLKKLKNTITPPTRKLSLFLSKKKKPQSLVNLCIGVLGRHLEDIIEDLEEIAIDLPGDIKLAVADIARRRKLLSDDVLIALADASWEILDVSGSDVSDFGLIKAAERCETVAVKVLGANSRQGEREFLTEVLSKLYQEGVNTLWGCLSLHQ
ncbi:hypothetical protein KIW84_035614 [Lathyrus oleraceus]|uniref:Uncharacterized protein n=1 Tax=Pisum sativum TaxID=3888 RepID=A0A9D4Y244_PEA|nr:hypothetical protein KIW84_035614 [Pisum sativum]